MQGSAGVMLTKWVFLRRYRSARLDGKGLSLYRLMALGVAVVTRHPSSASDIRRVGPRARERAKEGEKYLKSVEGGGRSRVECSHDHPAAHAAESSRPCHGRVKSILLLSCLVLLLISMLGRLSCRST